MEGWGGERAEGWRFCGRPSVLSLRTRDHSSQSALKRTFGALANFHVKRQKSEMLNISLLYREWEEVTMNFRFKESQESIYQGFTLIFLPLLKDI